MMLALDKFKIKFVICHHSLPIRSSFVSVKSPLTQSRSVSLVGDVSVCDVNVLPSDRRLIVESAAVAASDDPSSGVVGPRAIGLGKSATELTQTPTPEIWLAPVSIKLQARHFSQPPMLGLLPQSINGQQFTLDNPDLADRLSEWQG